MIVPQFWAESRLSRREKRRQVTVRRFGWSDTSQAEAQSHADLRVREAFDRVLAGERLSRRERKVAYNGAEGVPIREEVVGRHGETVITRNSYGARCLNTPKVLFADVDFADLPASRWFQTLIGALLLLAAATGWVNRGRVVVIAFGVLLVGDAIMRAVQRSATLAKGGQQQAARERISRFVAEHLQWNLRLYRTPAGLRVVATHQLFEPNDPETLEFFKAIQADPVYVAMCRNQQCFRARVSAKPWRIGIEAHLRPRPGVWPVAPERLPFRNAWIAEYENVARDYAACAFVESLGSGVVHPEARSVVKLHDDLCAATRKLPLA